jgi:hypothetical protein
MAEQPQSDENLLAELKKRRTEVFEILVQLPKTSALRKSTRTPRRLLFGRSKRNIRERIDPGRLFVNPRTDLNPPSSTPTLAFHLFLLNSRR